jgi:pyruvate/2-oxoglutarate dehydrogenase complex dihydrolipoamide dehydrogenase (E3) component
MRYDAAFEHSRQVAVERVRGLRFLVPTNNIDEYEGQGIFVDRHTLRIKSQDIDTQGAHLRGTNHDQLLDHSWPILTASAGRAAQLRT